MDRDFSIKELVSCLQIKEKEVRRLLHQAIPTIGEEILNPDEKLTRKEVKLFSAWISMNASQVGKGEVGWYLISLSNLLLQH
jgi:hypothetical protein